MASQKALAPVTRKNLLLWLTAITIVYQLTYQAIMMHTLRMEQTQDDECTLNGDLGTAPQSPFCQELQVFRTWKQMPVVAVPEPSQPRDADQAHDEEGEISVLPAPAGNSSAQVQEVLRQLSRIVGSTTTPAPLAASKAEQVAAPAGNLSHELLERNAELERGLQQVADDHAQWERDFEQKVLQAHAELCQDPDRKDSKTCKEVLAGIETTTPAVDEDGNAIPLEQRLAKAVSSGAWSRAFMQEVRQAQRDMCQEPQRKGRADCIELLAAIEAKERREVAAQQLVQSHNLTRELLEKTAGLEAGFHKVAEDHAAWEQGFEERVRKAHEDFCREPLRSERQDCVDFMASQEMAKSGTSDEWSHSFLREVRRVQREMCAEAFRKDRPDCVQLMAALDETEKHEAEAQQVAQKVNIADALREKTAEFDAGMRRVAEDHAAWSRDFEEKVRQAHADLCNAPERRGRPDCVAFLATQGDVDSASYSRSMMTQIRQAQREMCNEPQRRGRADCVQVLDAIAEAERKEKEAHKKALSKRASLRSQISKEAEAWSAALRHSNSEAAEVSAYPSLRAGGRELHWSKVAAWASAQKLPDLAKSLRGQGPVTMKPRELQASHWAGMIPKVACVAAVPSGHDAKERLEAFIANFHLQTYEGPSQLVLVYDYRDQEAARLVRLHADGFHVVAVESRAEDKFPSTSALRYGAWSAGEDAQVVAYWPFDVDHHPHRLSWQVRALAFSARPASLLDQLSAIEQKQKSMEDTLAGEARWMSRHWYPLLSKEGETLRGSNQGQLVHIQIADQGLGA